MVSAVTPEDFLSALLYQFTAMLQMEAALERICALIAVVGGCVVMLMLLREVRERREGKRKHDATRDMWAEWESFDLPDLGGPPKDESL